MPCLITSGYILYKTKLEVNNLKTYLKRSLLHIVLTVSNHPLFYSNLLQLLKRPVYFLDDALKITNFNTVFAVNLTLF